VRVCLPDLADTGPADIVGLISARGARSAAANSNSASSDIYLRYSPVSPGACQHDVVTSLSGGVTSIFGGALGSQDEAGSAQVQELWSSAAWVGAA